MYRKAGFAVLVFFLMFANEASAVRIEQLVMPGPLIEGHAELEDRCEDCHENFSKEAQSSLCRHCHEEVDMDVRKQKGYHGDKVVRNRECYECHTDHEGRGAIIILFNPETFNHEQTEFELKGNHKYASCAGCHEDDKKYREAKHECYACHKEDEPHNGLLGGKCNDCHTETDWDAMEFDHNKTDFPLRNKHRGIPCASCHPAGISQSISIECVSCHLINDVHGERYGKKCQDCHTAAGWEKGKFDHDQTDFPLRGSHEKVVCDACHPKHIYDDELETDCYSCHKKDDQHRGQNGKKCNDCHKTTQWKKVRFDHDKTDFPLKGVHDTIECTSCHKGDIYDEDLETTCFGCHSGDDVHKEDQGKACDDCHNEQGWNKKVIFDHAMTAFPLVGIHATAPCEECHLTQVYTDVKLSCDSCHRHDDVHEKKLTVKCILCHNPHGWGIWKFDHNTQTEYVLDGEHEDLDCHGCHTESVEGEISLLSTCVACHKKDDVHEGTLTDNCERCHVTSSFKDIILIR